MGLPGVEITDKRSYYGFVYMWCDTKLEMYYIGSHRGSVYDGYICSSVWCKRSIKSRPESFYRIILSFCDSEVVLNSTEEKYLKFYNAAESYMFYNFKNTGRGGCGPVKWKGMTKTQYYADRGILWVDPRKGRTREDIYGIDESRELVNNIVRKHKQFFTETGHGYGFGSKNKGIDWKKGKLYSEIYTESKPFANPSKPFIITVEEPGELPYDVYCRHEDDFFKKLNMDTTTISKIKRDGYKIVQRLLPSTRHSLPKKTILRIKYVEKV